MKSWVITFACAMAAMGMFLVAGEANPHTDLYPLLTAGSSALAVYSLVKIFRGSK